MKGSARRPALTHALSEGPGEGWTSLIDDPTTRREPHWTARHPASGSLLRLLGVILPLSAVRDTAFPLYWKLMPANRWRERSGRHTAMPVRATTRSTRPRTRNSPGTGRCAAIASITTLLP